MAKKKKRGGAKNDARGYATAAVAPKAVPQISTNEKEKAENVSSAGALDPTPTSVSVADKAVNSQPQDEVAPRRFYKRLATLYSQLSSDVGFEESQVKTILSNLAESKNGDLSFEAALDWACLHFEAKEMPPILTEGHIRELQTEQQDQVQGLSHPSGWSVEVVGSKPQEESKDDPIVFNQTPSPTLAPDPAVEKPDQVDSASKNWILNEYEYCDDDSGVEEDGTDIDGGEGKEEELTQACSGDHERTDETTHGQLGLLPEQVELQKLQEEIQDLEATLKDEPSNYMRSKAEIKQLQKELVQLKKKEKKSRGRVAKALAEANARAKEEEPEEEAMEGYGDFFGMFDEEQSNSPTEEPKANTAKDEPVDENGSHDDEPSIDLFRLSSVEPAIPDSWTGKTPKKILEEHCRKQKLPHPTFSKLGTNGCAVRIRFSVAGKAEHRPPLVLEQKGPFYSYPDAKNYVSTQALWELVGKEELPVYRLFPPVFSSLWKSWMQQEARQKTEKKNATKAEFDNKIKELVKLFPKAMWFESSDSAYMNTPTTTPIDETFNLRHSGGDDEKAGRPKRRNNLVQGVARDFLDRQKSKEYMAMTKMRAELPMYNYRNELLGMIENNAVTILCAETGAGKTTQCGAFLLENSLSDGDASVNILCTQPRRVAAMAVADRVAEEMCEPRGVGGLIGYQIRMESRQSSETRLLFCTTGVVLRRLQDDPNLKGVSHVLVDEVHERQWQIDFLLITLRRLLQTTRPDLKVVLMSATLDTKVFGSFFGNAPILNVPGRTFPVANYFLEDLLDATNHIIEADSRYAIRGASSTFQTETLWVTTKGGEKRREIASLESQTDVSEVSGWYAGYKMTTQRSMDRVDEKVINYDLIEDVLLLLVDESNGALPPPDGSSMSTRKNGAILIFLPGLGEIRALADRLQGSRIFGDGRRFDVIPLHSALSSQDQKRAFRLPPRGCRKLILSTNIAETSVTISDVVAVIDCGLVREIRQDKRYATNKLVLDWCSRASARQRAGRAGRVQPGICCKLFSSNTFEDTMREQAIPELQRVPLEEVCLNILAGRLASRSAEFLQQAPQPPSETSVKLALTLLQEVGALEVSATAQEKLTPLGYHLAKLPVHVRLGKMLIFGALFSCLDKALTVAAGLSVKSPFSASFGKESQAKAQHRVFQHERSDFLTLCNVWDAFIKNQGKDRGRRFCKQYYLSWTALTEISDSRKQFLELLGQLGFARGYNGRSKGDPDEWIKTSSPRLCEHSGNENLVHAVVCAGLYANVARVEHHVSDVPSLWHKTERLFFHSTSTNHNRRLHRGEDWLLFHEKFATSRCTSVSATAPVLPSAIFLFGGDISIKHMERRVMVDDWISLPMAAQTSVRFREVRSCLDQILSERLEKGNNHQDQETIFLKDVVHLLQDKKEDTIHTLMDMDLVPKY